eukprot:scaffold4071_cov136-Skeletonema_marinoi.AAC.2
MADQADAVEFFVYTGGRAPQHIINACISLSIDDIPDYAFNQCTRLVDVTFHDGVITIGKWAFPGCCSLQTIKLPGAKILRSNAFYNCTGLTEVEFGDKLETIGLGAFYKCTSLRKLSIKSVKIIESGAFNGCEQLMDVDLPEEVERMEQYAFANCHAMRRIAMPLKTGMIANNVFNYCENLERIDLVGGIHRTISFLHLERWRDDMNDEINRINQILPHTPATGTIVGGKNEAIKRWIETAYRKMEHYKTEHYRLLRELAILLELALWKAKLEENDEDSPEKTVSAKLQIRQCSSKRSEVRMKRRPCKMIQHFDTKSRFFRIAIVMCVR